MKYLLFLCMVLALCNCSGEVVIATDESSSGNESSSYAPSSISNESSQESSGAIAMNSESDLDESSESIYVESSSSNKEESNEMQSESSSLKESSTNTLSSPELSSDIEQESSIEYSSSSMVESSAQGPVYPYVHKSLYKNISTSEKVAALTFDDGPDFEAGSTEAFLQFFQEHDMKVTFFHIGQNAEAAPDIVWRVLEEGHQIGNHSMSHGHIIEKDIAGVEYEIKGFQDYYAETFNYTPTVFRAPFLEINDDMWNLLQTLVLPPIDALVDILDWGDQPAWEIKDRLINQIAPGAIVLCHERIKTLDVLKESIADLKSQGYQFVTLNELLEYQD